MLDCSFTRRVTHFINMFPIFIVLLFLEWQKQAMMMGMLVPIITVVIASCHSQFGRPVIWNVTRLWQHCATLVIMIYFVDWQYWYIPANWATLALQVDFLSLILCFLSSNASHEVTPNKPRQTSSYKTIYITVRTWQWRRCLLQDSWRQSKQLLILQGNFLFLRKLVRIQVCAWKKRLQNTTATLSGISTWLVSTAGLLGRANDCHRLILMFRCSRSRSCRTPHSAASWLEKLEATFSQC